jgi:hypothetical protein
MLVPGGGSWVSPGNINRHKHTIASGNEKNSGWGTIIKKGALLNSAPGSFSSYPATYYAPCSSLTTFPD